MKNEKELIKSVYKLVDFDITEPNNLAINLLSIKLEEEGLISYTIEYRENENDSWLQADYYCNKLEKIIVIDHHVFDSFESIDKFITTLIDIERQTKNIKEIMISSAIYRKVLKDLVISMDESREQGKVMIGGDLMPYQVVKIDQTMNAKIENAKELLK